MGSFFCDVLSMNHEVAIYDTDKERLRFTFNALRFTTMEEIKEFQPEMMINAVTVKYTIEAFNQVLPYLPATCIISDIASVKTGLPEFYATSGHPFVSSHPMFGPTFASLSNLSNENAIIITESDHLGKVFFRDLYNQLHLHVCEYSLRRECRDCGFVHHPSARPDKGPARPSPNHHRHKRRRRHGHLPKRSKIQPKIALTDISRTLNGPITDPSRPFRPITDPSDAFRSRLFWVRRV